MANTNSAWTVRTSPPSFASLAVGSTVTVTGVFATAASVAALLAARALNGKKFRVASPAGQRATYIVTRLK